ncbi:hypothetical protein HYT53_03560 [Candidatus Woesearchaeota archaeon]|nr:hypothetical protein [Candidatus Woesearchaeota archaeon]
MANLKELRRERNERVDLEGTPPAAFINAGDIAVDTANGGLIIDFESESKTSKYTPMSAIIVNNNSSSDLNVYVNQNIDWLKIVRSQTVLPIRDFPGIRSVRISKRNSAVTITAGQVEVHVERPPLTDDEFRRRQQKRGFISRMIGLIGG